jgi:hypothetical protein
LKCSQPGTKTIPAEKVDHFVSMPVFENEQAVDTRAELRAGVLEGHGLVLVLDAITPLLFLDVILQAWLAMIGASAPKSRVIRIDPCLDEFVKLCCLLKNFLSLGFRRNV